MRMAEVFAKTADFYVNWQETIFYYFEISYICILFFCKAARRGHSAFRIPLCILGFILTTFLLDGIMKQVVPHFMWVVNYALCVVWTSLCIRASRSCIFLYVGCAFSLQNFASALDKYLFQEDTYSGMVRLGLFFLCSITLFTLFYFFVIRRLPPNQSFDMEIDQLFVLFILMLVISELDSLLNKDGNVNALLAMLVQCSINAFIIMYLLYAAKKSELMTLKMRLEHYLDVDTQRYQQMRQDMEILDMKYHDFKQYIYYCQQRQMIDADLTEQMLSTLEDINQTPCCGNHALDIILSDKIYLCRHRKIRFTYAVDSTGLYRLIDSELASLFNNVLYNAIEYLSTLDDPEKRLLDLKVMCKNDFLIIRCENYCESTLIMDGDLPKTTKQDSENHGCGLKSVRYIVKKYGGELTISNKNQQMIVNIIIPISQI